MPVTDAQFAALAHGRSEVERWLAGRFGRAVAEDAVSEALLVVWARRERLDGRVRGYLFRVAFNAALHQLDGRAVASDLMDNEVSDAPDPHELVERRLRADELARALFHLRPDDAEALLQQAAGFSYAEIMERHGWTYTKVNRCVSEGREALRELMPAAA